MFQYYPNYSSHRAFHTPYAHVSRLHPQTIIVKRTNTSLLEGSFGYADECLIDHIELECKHSESFAEMHVLFKLREDIMMEVIGMREEPV